MLAWKRRHPVLAGLFWLFIGGNLTLAALGALLEGGASDGAMVGGIAVFAVLSVWFLFPAVAAIFGFDDPALQDHWRRAQEHEAARQAARRR